MDPKKIENAIRIAKDIEKKYAIKTSVIVEEKTSLMPWAGSTLPTIFLIIPLKEEHEKIPKVREEYAKESCDIRQTLPIEEWVSLIKANPQVIRNGMDAREFIPPFFFHHEVYGGYAKPLVQRLRQEFGPQLDKEIREMFARFETAYQSPLRKIKTALRRANESETKVLGRLEQREVFKGLKKMAEQIRTEGTEVIIAVDRSARPIGEPLRRIIAQTLGRKIPVYYLSLGPISKWHGTLTEADYLKAAELFAKEKPQIVKALKGKKVLIVDDIKGEGKTFRNLTALLGRFGPAQISQSYIREYGGIDLSWSRQELTNLQTFSDSFLTRRKRIGRAKAHNLRGLRRNIGVIEQKVIARLKRRYKM